MRILAIIPARGGSKGIPGKNIIKLCGRPLIVWSIEQALASKYIESVYISSDNDRILKISKNAGANIIKRPKILAGDNSPAEDALLHAISHIGKTAKGKIDIVVLLQATSPLRTSKDIDGAIKLFISEKADSLFSAAILEDFCVWERKKSALRSVTYDYRNRGTRQTRRPYYLENGSIYIFKPETIKKFRNRLSGKIVFYPMPVWKSYEIDKSEDIEVCRYYMRNKILKHNKHIREE